MNLSIVLAWRNLWRNRRRTLITMASIALAVMLASVMRSMQEGQYDQMIDNSVGQFTGHARIQHPAYQDEPSLDYMIVRDAEREAAIERLPGIQAVVPRIDTYALVSGHQRSKPVMIVGMDVHQEAFLSNPNAWIVSGDSLSRNDEQGVLLGTDLAAFLNLQLGDSLVILGQGRFGQSAAALLPVRGLFTFGLKDLNRQLVYVPIETAQTLLDAPGAVTALALLAESPGALPRMMEAIPPLLADEEVLLSWQTLMPEIVQGIDVDYRASMLMLAILYVLIGFGILGTVVMMMNERTVELRRLHALGATRRRLATMLLLEMLTLCALGVLVGVVLAWPVMLYFNINPLYFSGEMAATIEAYGMEPFLRFSLDLIIPLEQALFVGAMALVISLYPLWHIRRIRAVASS